MAVSPDFLLQTPSVDARPKVASRAPESAREPADGGRSSFSEVYARERQDKPAERPATASRQESAKPAGPAGAAGEDSAEKPTLAADGKPLPAVDEALPDEPVAEGELDPLLLFGLGGTPLPTVQTSAEPLAQPGLALTGLPQGVLLPGLPGEGAAAAGEGEPGNLGALGKADAKGLPGATVEPAGKPTEALLSLDAEAPVEPEAAAGEGLSGEVEGAFAELLESVEAPKESRPGASEPSAARVATLNPTLAQPHLQPSRPPLVPGQPVQMQQAGWSEAVTDRVMWLSSQNLKAAEIQLDPAELGRMEVRIEMNRDQAQVTFLSPHAGVRDALEGQVQRLREMFDQQGLGLLNVNVSDQSARGWQGREQGEAGSARGAGPDAGDDAERVVGSSEVAANRAGGGRGLVDFYA
ncbi:flagellar hook-length control protein FliK [Pseudomonas oligotrophica]|uniref:flagellar hook-length control protein FliK n=1 Tax=Pseudomonas oligotrophica TaxID=2912055 RepID=UPI001F2EC0D9|nr:flagellar hook-length control protein FliK [Pseudomonas oligotrophica]MCF7202756.1 flagellar hook-length control protein FliK [Pseudomonas oligotrophica]